MTILVPFGDHQYREVQLEVVTVVYHVPTRQYFEYYTGYELQPGEQLMDCEVYC